MTRDPHRFPVLIDAPERRASDDFYAAKRRRDRWTHYAVLAVFLIAMALGAALLASMIGKAAANVEHTLEQLERKEGY